MKRIWGCQLDSRGTGQNSAAGFFKHGHKRNQNEWQFRRFRSGWVDNVEMDLKLVQWVGVNWILLARNGDQSRTAVITVTSLAFYPRQKISCPGRRLLASWVEPCFVQLKLSRHTDGLTERRTKIIGWRGVNCIKDVNAQQSRLHRGMSIPVERANVNVERIFACYRKNLKNPILGWLKIRRLQPTSFFFYY